MEIKITINEDIFRKLNSDAVKYYLGTNESTTEIEPRIIKLLNDIEHLAESTNQLEHLECMGVDNWGEYSHYTCEDDEEDEEDY
jgi:hypothetical protein